MTMMVVESGVLLSGGGDDDGSGSGMEMEMEMGPGLCCLKRQNGREGAGLSTRPCHACEPIPASSDLHANEHVLPHRFLG